MISLRRNRKPLLLGNINVDVIGDEKRLVQMNLEAVDHRTVTVVMLPETAIEMLEELSTSTLGVVKRNKQNLDMMFR